MGNAHIRAECDTQNAGGRLRAHVRRSGSVSLLEQALDGAQ
jgi:hypothetical protein